MSWPVVKIKTVCQQVRGVTYKKDKVSDAPKVGYVKLYRSNNISPEGGLNEYKLIYVHNSCVKEKQLLKTYDILITASTGSKSAIGKNAQLLNDIKVTFGAFCKTLRPKQNLVDPLYLGYFFKRPEFRAYISNVVEGANINNLKNEHIDELDIPLPPLPVQKQIAAVLEKADTLRSQCQQMEKALNSLAQSVFLDMFGDYKKSDQSDFMTLGDCANVCSGVTKGQKFGDKPTVTVPYMRVANVQDGYLDLNEIKEIEAKITDYEKYLLKVGDVLMTEGGDFDKLGRGAVWEGQIDGCIHQNHVFRVRLDERYLPKFFECLLQSQYAKQYFLKCAKKTTNLASINITQLKSLPMPQVDLKLQQEFVSFISKLDKHKQYLEQTKQQLDENFNSLMQRAFKGELELKDVA